MRFKMKTIKQELTKSIISKTLNEINFNEGFAMLSNEINEIKININLTIKVSTKKVSIKIIKIINLNLHNNVFDTFNKIINMKKEKAKTKDYLIFFFNCIYFELMI